MPRSFIFFVDTNTWREHNRVGIAGINEPGGWRSNTAYSEVSGIRAGDRIFFRLGRQQPSAILGLFEAESAAYYDPGPLFPGAEFVSDNLPIRVRYRCRTYYPNPLSIEDLWLSKERGKIWTIQQSRGDVLGRHACINIDEEEADLIVKLLEAANPIRFVKFDYESVRRALGISGTNRLKLPISKDTDAPGQLKYEAALQARLAEHLANGEFKETVGDYTHFLTYVTTGAQSEMDVVLVKRDGNEILWYEVIELKRSTFDIRELQKVIAYEKWVLNSRCDNALQIHSVGVAHDFDEKVIEYVDGRRKYGDRPIRLIRYSFDSATERISLSPL